MKYTPVPPHPNLPTICSSDVVPPWYAHSPPSSHLHHPTSSGSSDPDAKALDAVIRSAKGSIAAFCKGFRHSEKEEGKSNEGGIAKE